MRSNLLLIVLAAVALLLGLLAADRYFKTRAASPLATGTLLPEPRALADFRLTDESGEPFTRASFEGRWNLVFTGFTQCPDVCPNTLALLKSVASRLEERERLRVVFVSVDPARDTPQALQSYVRYFSPDFRAATGPNDELDKLAESLGFAYVKVPGATAESYTMDHSAALILVDPQARLAGYFTPPYKADALATDLNALLESRG